MFKQNLHIFKPYVQQISLTVFGLIKKITTIETSKYIFLTKQVIKLWLWCKNNSTIFFNMEHRFTNYFHVETRKNKDQRSLQRSAKLMSMSDIDCFLHSNECTVSNTRRKNEQSQKTGIGASLREVWHLHTDNPPYILFSWLFLCRPSRVLWSSANLLQLPRINLNFGSRFFHVAAPSPNYLELDTRCRSRSSYLIHSGGTKNASFPSSLQQPL